MFTIRETTFAETVEKRSKFLSYLVSYSAFDIELQRLRDKHPKANHIVHAFRYINKYQQIVEGSSDDGEPKGCAGIPTLNVLRGAELVECALLTVRYFGGIKLGTGGMARAYGAAARAAVEAAMLTPYLRQESLTMEAHYPQQRALEYLLEKHGIRTVSREFTEQGVRWQLEGSAGELEAFCNATGRTARFSDNSEGIDGADPKIF